ncbi:hypothetical protein HPB49_021461 [Dermacentor silvarum]|uniref:Uncharacterized protein n=1 Tax=Dermacentor silvarum TaxID=543639 RepID=A0ACB8D8B0_DERSI|nr:hypothetical protein HPB49_021461 [Dermacentor silvarum]
MPSEPNTPTRESPPVLRLVPYRSWGSLEPIGHFFYDFALVVPKRPSDGNDGSDETLSHILLECAGYTHARDSLTAAYRRLGLPSDNADVFLFPRGHPSIIKRAFTALLDFFESTTLYTRL